MRSRIPILLVLSLLLPACDAEGQGPPTDRIPTGEGDLSVTFIGHGTLMMEWQGKVIHIDPVSREGDYEVLPDADLILITHAHGDHLDPDAVAQIRREDTLILAAPPCAEDLEGETVLANGERWEGLGLRVEAVPAYNIVHMRSEGQPYHPKGEGNGYVITFVDLRVYVAGDTEDIPEMKTLEGIDVAFLPMNLPYTMSPEMAADAARAFRPRILYPYHYGRTDPRELKRLLADEEGIEVRIRPM
ncbi:MAG: MBL fold metallo-hydrolase [bacterium]